MQKKGGGNKLKLFYECMQLNLIIVISIESPVRHFEYVISLSGTHSNEIPCNEFLRQFYIIIAAVGGWPGK